MFKLLENALLNLGSFITTNIYPFVSPETLLKNDWMKLMNKLNGKKVMRVLVIDEVHLFVEFGMSFRKSICDLKTVLFDKSWSNKLQVKLRLPILFMTATFNREYMKYLLIMTGVKLNDEHIHWGKKETFSRRHVIISATVTTQRLRMVKSLLNKHLQSDDAKIAILV